MKKLLLFGIPMVVLLLVIVYIVSFMININKVKAFPNDLQITNQEKNHTKSMPRDWRRSFENKASKKDFNYPITEISIDLNLYKDVNEKYRHRVRQFKLETQKLNTYHFFCLKQVLDQLHMHHKLEAYQNEIGVILYSDNSSRLNQVVINLEKYGIKSSIEEIIRK